MRKLVYFFVAPFFLTLLFLAAGCNVQFDYHIQFMVDGEKYAYVGTDKKDISMPKNPSKEHYVFDGWFWEDGEEFTLLSIADQPLSENNDYKVYARWKGVECSFVYGYNERLIGNVRYGEKVDVEVPTRPNYIFTGYYLNGEQITDKQGNGLAPWYYTEEKTLTPKWTEGKITLLFTTDATDAFVSPPSKDYLYLSEFGTLPTPSTRYGYDFAGWYTEKKGAGKKITETTVCDFTKQTSLYAHWIPKTYVAYLDWGEGSGAASYSFRYGEPFLPPDPLTSPTGKQIAAWYRFNEYWEQGEEILIDTPENVTLTAEWELTPYTVTLIFNERCTNGFTSPYSFETHYDLFYPDSFPHLEKTGYEFQGWYTRQTGGEKVNLSGKHKYPQSLTLYPQWKKTEYTLSFLAPGYEGTLPTFSYTYGDTLPDMPMNITRPGERLLYWWDGTNTESRYTPTTPLPAYNLTLEGVWEEYYADEENASYTKLTSSSNYKRVYDFQTNKICALRKDGVDVYDGETKQKLHTFPLNGTDIDAYANRLIVGSGQTAILYDLSSFSRLQELPLTSNVEAVKLTENEIIVSTQDELIFYDLEGTAYKTHENITAGALAINREDNLVYRLSKRSGFADCTIGAYTLSSGELVKEVTTMESYMPKEFYFAGCIYTHYGRYDKTTLTKTTDADKLPDEFKTDDTAGNARDGHYGIEILYEDERYAVVYTYYWENQYDYDADFYYRTLRLFDKTTNTFVDEIYFQNKCDNNDNALGGYYTQTVEYGDGKLFFSNGGYAGVWTLPV